MFAQLGRLLVLCVLGSALQIAAASFPYQFAPEHPRKISIGETPLLTLVSGGKIQFELVVPSDASPSAQYAGEEAAELLSKAFGKTITVVAAASGQVPAIIIGCKATAVEAGIDLNQLDRDGFRIKTSGNNILIIGRDDLQKRPLAMSPYGDGGERATLFGVYNFLELFAGVRFYFPGELGVIIPERQEWKLPAIDIYDRPDKVQRNHYASWSANALPDEFGKPFPKNYMLRQRAQSWTWPCCHGLGKQGYETRFSQTHPEYFAHNEKGESVLAFRAGEVSREQLCFSSGIREEIIQDAIAFLSGRPASERNIHPYTRSPQYIGWHQQLDIQVPVFDVTPEDSYYPCRCEKCCVLFTPGRHDDKPLSEFMWRYYEEVANRVKGKGYISAWVYWPTLYEPEFQLPENLLLVMCPRGPWSCGNETFFRQESEKIAVWGKRTGGRLRLWNYMIKSPRGTYKGVPTVAPRAVARYYHEVAPSICGAFSEVVTERFMFQYLNLYVYYKVLWDSQLDVEKLLAEHHNLMFGLAAKPMAAVYDELERLWLGMAGYSVNTPSGPVAVATSDFDIWNKHFSAAKVQELNRLFLEAENAVPKDSLAQKRIKFIHREIFQPVLTRQEEYLQSQAVRDSWKMFAVEASTPPTVDGILDDAAWKTVTPVFLSGFKRDTVDVNTTVRMLFDKDNFYFGFESFEPDTANMQILPYPADDSNRWANSTVEGFLNPDGRRQNFYQLMLDPAGGLTDYRNWQGAYDLSWNSGAEVKTAIEPGHKWTAEIRLPRQSMDEAQRVFPANFTRHRARVQAKNEMYSWNPFMNRYLEVDKWGTVTLGTDDNPSLLKYGDFEIPVSNQRWLGPWYADSVLELDHKVFLTGGASVRLTSAVNRDVVQRFLLKPETTYEVSYFVKLDKVGEKSSGGLRARFDERGGNVHWLPQTPLRGTIPWTRISQIITTHKNCGTKREGPNTEYINIFLSSGTDGTAWIDHVEVREVK